MNRVHRAETVEEAVRILADLGAGGSVLAGGTWIMRAPVRGEPLRRAYVSLNGLPELRGVATGDGTVRIGALATHAELGGLDGGIGPLGALAAAARRSAFPAVRNVATLGGNLAAPFPEADLVPPLLAAGAELELSSPRGPETVAVAEYLSRPRTPGELILGVRVPSPAARRSSFERLTVRAAAEYSIASVAVSLDLGDAGEVTDARIAVGAVQDVPARIPAAEAALRGRRLDGASVEAAGAAAATALTGRDGLDAPGWYRVAVLPTLMRRALERLAHPEEP